jgi:hypothetical protein
MSLIYNMRVAVVMFYDDAIREYGDLTYKINQLYCQKHGLDLICGHDKKYSDRHPAWERLPLMLEHLQNYDYLVWVDADAFFYHHSTNIVDLIKSNSGPDFLFSQDLGNNNLNTGIFIVKNTNYAHLFLNKWAYDEELYKLNPYPQWWDQGVLIKMVHYNSLDIQQHSAMFAYGVLQHFFKHELQSRKIKPFIIHLAGWSKQDRILTAKLYLDMIKTNLVSSVPSIV